MTEETIFALALEKQTPTERAAFLNESCGADAALRRRIEALIDSHERAADFLEKPAIEQVAVVVAQAKDCTAATDAIKPANQGISLTPGETQTEPPREGEDGLSLDFLAPSDKPNALGRIGHYHVLAIIGRGGMGVVLKAFDEELQRVVAIKVMLPLVAATGTARKRFRREAQAAAAVRDEHVINIHAVEEVNGLPYLVMEYISGLSLQERLDQSGPLELKEILRIGMQTANGLAKAHAQGLIHRDIKPANILLENGVQRVKITDFGLARAVDDASLTQSGVIAGTPQYMAPEQARGETVDHRADLFSLGSVLYAMCTGHPPFRANATMAVLKRVCEDAPRPIREVNPEIPDWLCAIIDKLHAKDPAQRFQSATEVAELLGQHLAHLQQPAVAPMPPRVAAPRSGSARKHSQMAACILAAVALIFLLGSCVWPIAQLWFYSNRLTEKPQLQNPTDSKPSPPRSREIALASPNSVGSCVAFSPDGRFLAIGDSWVVRLWDRKEGKTRDVLRGHQNRVWCLAFSPDSQTLASGSFDGTIRLWDVATGKSRFTLTGHTEKVWSVAFDSTGKRLASASEDKTARLWDVAPGKPLGEPFRDEAFLYAVLFTHDDKNLITGGFDGAIRVWDIAMRKAQRSLDEHSSPIRLALTRDGKTLASGSTDSTVKLWNLDTGKLRHTLRGHKQPVEAVAFSPNGKLLASVGGDYLRPDLAGEVKLWNAATGEEALSLGGHKKVVHGTAFSPDGKILATASADGTVKLWDVPENLLAENPLDRPPFVILGHGKADRSFPTLIEAVANSKATDTIEVRGDGPFWIDAAGVPIRHALTIRAGAGSRPVFKLAQAKPGQGRNKHILDAYAPITLEGLDFDRTGEHEGSTRERAALFIQNGPLHMTNCRLRTGGLAHYLVWLRHVHETDIRNCLFAGPALQAICVAECSDDDRLALTNCIIAGINRAVLTENQDKPASSLRFRLTGNTFSALPLSWNHSSSQELRVEARDNVVTGPGVIDFLHFPRIQSWKQMAAAVRWEAKRNLYLAGRSPVLIDWRPTNVLAELDGWKAGIPRFVGGDDQTSPVAMQKPDFWRLAADSPGKGAGENGDLGANVDLVGPGPAYERWKATTAYPQWLKDTNQARKPAAQPFAILSRGNKAEQTYDSLAEAVAVAEEWDIIEIRGDGPFRVGKAGVHINRPLTIRATSGYQPVLQMVSTEAGEERSKCLIQAWASLILEGITFDRTGKHEARSMNMAALIMEGGQLHMSNCRLVSPHAYFLVWLNRVPRADIRHCQFHIEGGAAIVRDDLQASDRLGIRDCLFDQGWSPAVVINSNKARPNASVQVELVHNTLARPALGWDHETPVRQSIDVEAQGNLITSSLVLRIRQVAATKEWPNLVRKVRWRGRQNLYPANHPLIALERTDIEASSGLDAWNRLWEQPEPDSRVGVARFKGGIDPRRFEAPGEADSWHLVSDSPGHRAGKDNRDLGADIDLLGPGPAYERWKKTPEYRQWLKAKE